MGSLSESFRMSIWVHDRYPEVAFSPWHAWRKRRAPCLLHREKALGTLPHEEREQPGKRSSGPSQRVSTTPNHHPREHDLFTTRNLFTTVEPVKGDICRPLHGLGDPFESLCDWVRGHQLTGTTRTMVEKEGESNALRIRNT